MKRVFKLIGIAIVGGFVASCCPSRTFMVGTNGIATYNRHTGQFEVLWEYAEKPLPVIHDTIYIDSCNVAPIFNK